MREKKYYAVLFGEDPKVTSSTNPKYKILYTQSQGPASKKSDFARLQEQAGTGYVVVKKDDISFVETYYEDNLTPQELRGSIQQKLGNMGFSISLPDGISIQHIELEPQAIASPTSPPPPRPSRALEAADSAEEEDEDMPPALDEDNPDSGSGNPDPSSSPAHPVITTTTTTTTIGRPLPMLPPHLMNPSSSTTAAPRPFSEASFVNPHIAHSPLLHTTTNLHWRNRDTTARLEFTTEPRDEEDSDLDSSISTASSQRSQHRPPKRPMLPTDLFMSACTKHTIKAHEYEVSEVHTPHGDQLKENISATAEIKKDGDVVGQLVYKAQNQHKHQELSVTGDVDADAARVLIAKTMILMYPSTKSFKIHLPESEYREFEQAFQQAAKERGNPGVKCHRDESVTAAPAAPGPGR